MQRRRRRALTFALCAALLLGGGYVTAVAFAPTPDPQLTIAEPFAGDTELVRDPAPAQAVVDAQSLPTAIGWQHTDTIFSNDDTAYPLASLSKLVTVLVAQEARPLLPGSDGETYTWTAADRELQEYYLSLDGVAYPIPVGTQITTRQMMQFIFLPSSNDYATAYAYSIFGDNETFLAAVHDWADRHGLDSLEFVEPSGMDEDNRANAADLLRIGKLVLADPALAEFTGTPAASMPWGVGVVENTNPLLSELPGMIGVKTGRSSSAGFNYIAAQEVQLAGRDLVQMSVTLARPSSAARAQSGRDMLAALVSLPGAQSVVTAGDPVATLTDWRGDSVTLSATETVSPVLTPGESVTAALQLAPASQRGAGGDFGELVIRSAAGEQRVPLAADGTLPEVSVWWKLAHPVQLWDATQRGRS